MYELTIRELKPYTPEEENVGRIDRDYYPGQDRFSDKRFHETRVMQVMVSEEEMQAIKKAVMGVM